MWRYAKKQFIGDERIYRNMSSDINFRIPLNAQIIVSLRVRRKTIFLDGRLRRLVKPFQDLSISVEDAISHIGSELKISRQAAYEQLHCLHYNGFVSISSRPVAYFEKDEFKLLVRPAEHDRVIVGEVQNSYYLDQINLKEAMSAIDIGGHIGSFSAYIKFLNPKLRVITLEPEVSNIEMMRLNLGDLPDVYPYHGLLTYSKKRIKLIRHKNNSGGHLSTAFWPSGWDPNLFEEVSSFVPPVTIEQLLEFYNIDRLSILKIDCEGCEFDLLNNVSPDTLSRVDRIVGEYHETIDGFKRRIEGLITPIFDIVDVASHKHTDTSGKFYAVNKRLSRAK